MYPKTKSWISPPYILVYSLSLYINKWLQSQTHTWMGVSFIALFVI